MPGGRSPHRARHLHSEALYKLNRSGLAELATAHVLFRQDRVEHFSSVGGEGGPALLASIARAFPRDTVVLTETVARRDGVFSFYGRPYADKFLLCRLTEPGLARRLALEDRSPPPPPEPLREIAELRARLDDLTGRLGLTVGPPAP